MDRRPEQNRNYNNGNGNNKNNNRQQVNYNNNNMQQGNYNNMQQGNYNNNYNQNQNAVQGKSKYGTRGEQRKYIGGGENTSYKTKKKSMYQPQNQQYDNQQYDNQQHDNQQNNNNYYSSQSQNNQYGNQQSIPQQKKNNSANVANNINKGTQKVADKIVLLQRTMPVDFTLLFAVLTLMLFGIVMIFSASYYTTMTRALYNYDMFYFLKRQVIWVILGILAMGFCMNLPYVIWKNFANLSYGIAIVFQLLLFTPLGIKINGQTRWLGLGETISFQPSEFTKIALIIFLSKYLATNRDSIKDFAPFVKVVGFLAFPVILIAVSNFSSALLIFLMGATIIFIASPNIKYFIYAGLASIPLIAGTILVFPYRISRITTWLDPWSDPLVGGFQTIQGLLAIASGGFFGLGLGQSRQKTFIPESHNDIIFPIICEELGIIGAAFVIILFAVVIYRGIRIAMNAKENFGLLMASGITAVIAFQAIINIGVVTNTIPNTGQPLPFISYGGTSLLFLSAMVGILLNISKYQRF